MSVQLNTETDAEIILRMADLIEKGSQGREQATGYYWKDDGSVCAMGAALLGAGINFSERYIHMPMDLHVITWPKVTYPQNTNAYANWMQVEGACPLPDAIMSLNDKAGWDFAHIVLWLRSVAAGMVTPETA